MFEDKNSPPNSPNSPTIDDLNSGKNFPFKKLEKRLSSSKGSVEDILAGTEGDSRPIKKLEPEFKSQESSTLKSAPRVPSHRRGSDGRH